MIEKIQLPAIIIANAMGLTILFVIAVANFWRLKNISGESKPLIIIFFGSVLNCIADPICFIADGKAGLFCRILVIGGNTLFYIGGMIVATAWIYLVISHLKIILPKIFDYVIYGIFNLVIIALIINFFVPIVFTVNEDNVYTRQFGYWVYLISYVCFMFVGLFLYLREWIGSGGLKFFPAWAFLIPAAIGIVAQAIFYGISTASPFVTVSLACVILCLQNEFMLRDKLTNLYNRFYLNTIEKRALRFKKTKFSLIMLDINGFKQINDNFGHKVGDEALIQLANIITDAVGRLGEVVRYAGDEFIIVVNSKDENCPEKLIARINEMLDTFNQEDSVPYKLSVATGYCTLNSSEISMDEYMDKVDELMYDNKQTYYQTHSKYDRLKKEKGISVKN